jgi:phosphate ABC transporter permease protein PstC
MTQEPSDRQQPRNSATATAGFDQPLLLSPSQDIKGFLVSLLGRGLLLAVTSTSVLAVLLIFAFVAGEAWPFFKGYSLLHFLGSTSWNPTATSPAFGALSLITGSAYVTIGSLIVAVPLGLLAAVFLSDVVSFRIREVVKPVIELLAAIPSVAYGFFAVLVLAPWLQNNFGFSTGTNALNASLILAVMALPTIISVSEDAISATGRELREASYGLGATRFETVAKVVLPAAHSGVIAGIVLGMMRAIGETMVVWMASGNASQIPSPWWDISQSIRTMTATIAGDMGETVKGSEHYRALFAVGALLLAFTFVLNMLSEYFLHQMKRLMGGRK